MLPYEVIYLLDLSHQVNFDMPQNWFSSFGMKLVTSSIWQLPDILRFIQNRGPTETILKNLFAKWRLVPTL
ncbi:protein of unknown function [Denitratisoma oestradiolicum]|uniref:Uncharacterized protein n=1 Tax=Denitratisoma oestradiolicum TaxID=311182 RepID=A0A6S6XZM4_9PROT|nr:protein of unknown function [Denitratisoma oestradiolicum]